MPRPAAREGRARVGGGRRRNRAGLSVGGSYRGLDGKLCWEDEYAWGGTVSSVGRMSTHGPGR